jgi:tetratricopeptide (TPR) repeat protein
VSFGSNRRATRRRGRGALAQDDEVKRAVSLHAEADGLCDVGKHREAAARARAAIRLFERSDGLHHPDVANGLLTLGRSQELGDAWQEALRSYERANALLNRYSRRRDSDIRRLRVKVARALCGVTRMLGRHDRARSYGLRAVALAERWFGRGDLDLAGALNDLGMVCKYQDRYAEALRRYRQALSIVRAAGLGDSAEAASIYHNLGGIAHAQGRYARAEAPARRAVALCAQSPRHPAFAAHLAALAAVLEGRGKLDEASACYRRALAIFRRIFGPRCYEVGVNLAGLAGVFRARRRYTQAINFYRESHVILRRVLGPRHLDVAITLNNLASVLAFQGRRRQALRTARQAATAFRYSAGPHHPSTRACAQRVAELEIDRPGR